MRAERKVDPSIGTDANDSNANVEDQVLKVDLENLSSSEWVSNDTSANSHGSEQDFFLDEAANHKKDADKNV